MRYLLLKKVAAEKSLSIFTLRKFVKGGLPHYQLGRKILVDPDEFDGWFAKHYKISSQPAGNDIGRLVDDVLAGMV